MKPIEFPQQTTVLAKNQPEYLPLPVFSDGEQMVSCWELSWVERLKLLFTGKLWLRQLTYGNLLQPQRPQVEYPFNLPASFHAQQ
jgi:hypothetical protein